MKRYTFTPVGGHGLRVAMRIDKAALDTIVYAGQNREPATVQDHRTGRSYVVRLQRGLWRVIREVTHNERS